MVFDLFDADSLPGVNRSRRSIVIANVISWIAEVRFRLCFSE